MTSRTLRILAINDVYELQYLPSFASLVKTEKDGSGSRSGKPDKVIATVAGDFCSPSQLSSLDHGRGMVELLNASGIDFACVGSRCLVDASFPVTSR